MWGNEYHGPKSSHSRRYDAEKAVVDPCQQYSIENAVQLLVSDMQDASRSEHRRPIQFDQRVDAAFRANIKGWKESRSQAVYAEAELPHGTGKENRVAVVAPTLSAEEIEQAGAVIMTADEIREQVYDGLQFDVLIVTQNALNDVGPLGRHLGPKGLMPSPKAGTLVPPDTEKVLTAIQKNSSGFVRRRMDAGGNFHCPIGRASFEVDQLVENFAEMLEGVRKARPQEKGFPGGPFPAKASISATHSPSVKVQI